MPLDRREIRDTVDVVVLMLATPDRSAVDWRWIDCMAASATRSASRSSASSDAPTTNFAWTIIGRANRFGADRFGAIGVGIAATTSTLGLVGAVSWDVMCGT